MSSGRNDQRSQPVSESVVFDAVVCRVVTLADGGIRISLDISEDSIPEAAMLMAFKREGVALRVTVEPMAAKQETSGDEAGNMAGRSEWKPKGQTTEKPRTH